MGIYRNVESPQESTKSAANDREKSLSFLTFAERWLGRHFGKILGEEHILSKALVFLSAVVIVYFNYLKHQYDVGYYHKTFGVPESYLGAAWNSSMTDFVLNALLFLVYSVLIVAFLGSIAVFAVWLLSKFPPKVTAVIISVMTVSCIVCCIGAWNGQPFFVKLSKAGLGCLVSVIGVLILVMIAFLIGDSYKKEQLSGSETGYLEGYVNNMIRVDREKACEKKAGRKEAAENETAPNIKAADETVCGDDVGTEKGNEESASSKTKNVVLSAREKWSLIAVVLALICLVGFGAGTYGSWMACLETELMYLCQEEAVEKQLHELSRKETDEAMRHPAYWAVVCQAGDRYVIVPCEISEAERDEKAEITVYPRYHSVIPSENVVVVSQKFGRMTIDGNQMVNEPKLGLWDWLEKKLGGGKSGGSDATRQDITQTESEPTAAETTEPDFPIPDSTETDPTVPDPTETEPTVPEPTETDPPIPEPTETDPTVPDPPVPDPTVPDPPVPGPTEPDFPEPLGCCPLCCPQYCGCCRCTPGLG